jgi:RHS repeat-associated protein
LVRITQGANVYEFVYDGHFRRVAEKLNGTVTKRFLWNGTQIAEQRDPTGTTIQRQYYSQGEKRLSGTDSGNYYYTRDHLSSVREVVNQAGVLVARYDYDAYGKRSTLFQSASYLNGCTFGYTGHLTLPSLAPSQSELVLTHYRGYDPQLGRWLSADPIGEAGGMNLYGYVKGDPINRLDQLGLAYCKISTSYGITMTGENVDPAFIRSFLSLMSPGEMIREFFIDGHGFNQGISTNDQTKEGIGIEIGISSSGAAVAIPVWSDTFGRISDQLNGHVDKDSKFRFDGCNTANNRPGFKGSANNLTKAFSEAFPDAEVTGLRGLGWIGNPFTGNANHVGGITRTYRGGIAR